MIQTIGILQQKQVAAMTLSCSPTTVYLSTLGGAESGYTNTVTVTATTGNSWTASILSGDTWIKINGSTGGSATGIGNGSFVISTVKYFGSRSGTVRVLDSVSNSVTITVGQNVI